MFAVLASALVLLGQAPEAKSSDLTPQEARTLKIALKELESSDGNPSPRTIQTLLNLGPKAASAAPQLVKMLEKASSADRDENENARYKYSLAAMNAASVLGEIGPAATDAYPALLKVFDAKESLSTPKRHRTGPSLSLRCFMAVPLVEVASAEQRKELAKHFGEAVKSRNRVEVESILEGLAALGPIAAPAIPAIVERMRSEKRFGIDRDGCLTLAAIGPEAVPALIDHYKWSVQNKQSPTYVLDAFIAMGSKAEKAVSFLVDDGLLDANEAIRAQAAEALGKIGSGDKKALTALMEAAQADESLQVKQKAMGALLATGKPAVPVLVEMFRKDPHNPGYPLAFSQFGPVAKEALPLVLQSLRDKNDEVRICSVMALRSFEDSSPEVIAALREVALKDTTPRISSAAAAAAKYLLSPKKSAAPRRR